MMNQQKLVSDQETTITKQKQDIAEQNEKYKALDNLYNALENILSTQLTSIQSLKNQLDRHSETVDIHTPTNITDDFRSVLDGSGNGKATVSGFYLFATSILRYPMNQNCHAALMLNGKTIATAHSGTNIHDQGSQTVVLKDIRIIPY
ncbi:hypothetical protein DPMN_137084 [Dreissena polymorpha]|uniref:C1q domain-containing protein n=1 Tax=Dreissena polymorpha TaxID=45954 RepID=A0A9D4G202_DREPO|nr:hypothetical protein DPMN_137084 [Dreissena polymorpha]